MSDDRDLNTITVSAQRRHDAAAAPDGAVLTAVYPPQLDWSRQLNEAPAVVGRHPGTGDGVELPHSTVSRQHFRVAWNPVGQSHTIEDLGSHNGLRVGGAPVAQGEHPLRSNDVIQAGDVLLVYESKLPSRPPTKAIDHTAVPGRAQTVEALRNTMAAAAGDRSPVLLIGETGTGKEWIARELHRTSNRPGELVAVNCAALSPQLIESELFGHVKGAFTGATEARPGYFRAAEDGTLFLDEIGELPIELQPKLLRALQEYVVQPVGGTRAVRVDVRFVAATNRPLAADVEAGRFRRDLYARVALWEVAVPALRERRVDILSWLHRLHRRWCEQRSAEETKLQLDAEAAALVLNHDWPDNLRGLDRLVHWLARRPAGGDRIRPRDLPEWLRASATQTTPAPPTTARQTKKRPTPPREEIAAALERYDGNIAEVARHFGRARKQIYRWIDAMGLDRDGD